MNMDMPPTGENNQEKIEREKQRFADFLQSHALSKEEIGLLLDSNKEDTERQRAIDMLKKHDISEFEASLLIDLCRNNLENRKWIKKEEVFSLLEEKGLNDETRPVVVNWKMEQEILVFKENTSKANILLSLEMVDFYAVTKDIEGIFSNLKEIHGQLIDDKSLTQEDIKEISEKLFAKIFSSAEIVQQIGLNETLKEKAQKGDYTEFFEKIDHYQLN